MGEWAGSLSLCRVVRGIAFLERPCQSLISERRASGGWLYLYLQVAYHKKLSLCQPLRLRILVSCFLALYRLDDHTMGLQIDLHIFCQDIRKRRMDRQPAPSLAEIQATLQDL